MSCCVDIEYELKYFFKDNEKLHQHYTKNIDRILSQRNTPELLSVFLETFNAYIFDKFLTEHDLTVRELNHRCDKKLKEYLDIYINYLSGIIAEREPWLKEEYNE